MPGLVFLFTVVALLSTLGGILLWRRRLARRREFLQGAAQYLGLQYLEGEAAWEQAQQEQREEGMPPVPEFLERLVRKAVSPRLSGQFRRLLSSWSCARRAWGPGSPRPSAARTSPPATSLLAVLVKVAAAFAG